MKKQKATAAVTIPANSTVGLTAQQYSSRAHNLIKLRQEGEILICELRNPIQFKIGEEFYADELPKSMASLVESLGEEGEFGVVSDAIEFAQMSVTELKAYLESCDVEIPKGAKKPALIALAESLRTFEEDGAD